VQGTHGRRRALVSNTSEVSPNEGGNASCDDQAGDVVVEKEGGGRVYDLSKGESMAGYVGEHDRNVPEDDKVEWEEPAEAELEEPAEEEWEEPVQVHAEVCAAEPADWPRDHLELYNRANSNDNDDDDDEGI